MAAVVLEAVPAVPVEPGPLEEPGPSELVASLEPDPLGSVVPVVPVPSEPVAPDLSAFRSLDQI